MGPRESTGGGKRERSKAFREGSGERRGRSADSWALEERAWGWGRVPTAPRQQKAAEHRLWVQPCFRPGALSPHFLVGSGAITPPSEGCG